MLGRLLIKKNQSLLHIGDNTGSTRALGSG